MTPTLKKSAALNALALLSAGTLTQTGAPALETAKSAPASDTAIPAPIGAGSLEAAILQLPPSCKWGHASFAPSEASETEFVAANVLAIHAEMIPS